MGHGLLTSSWLLFFSFRSVGRFHHPVVQPPRVAVSSGTSYLVIQKLFSLWSINYWPYMTCLSFSLSSRYMGHETDCRFPELADVPSCAELARGREHSPLISAFIMVNFLNYLFDVKFDTLR